MEEIYMHKPGDNITILNTSYHHPYKDESGKLHKDYITLVYKDADTGEKEQKTIYEPEYTYYMANDGIVPDYNMFFIPKDKVHPITVKFKDLEKDIAKRTGKLDLFYENCTNKNRSANKMLHMDTRIFSSDLNINVFYRIEFDRTYKNTTCEINKSYLDIETDIKYINGDFPKPGECPVNAVSFLIDKVNTEYTFLLRDKNNPLISKFEKYMKENDFISEFKSFLTDTLGGWKNLHRFKLQDLKHKIIFYDDEAEMLTAVFRLCNYTKPDFVLAWNMAFDIPFIIERLKVLGVDPRFVMCHPDFPEKEVSYFIDENHYSNIEARGDYADISSYSVFLDQMIQFASRRKGQSAFSSFSLDSIGEQIAGVHKLDYHHITEDLAELPYLDYKTFVMYNMMDVIVQRCIESKTSDIDYTFNKSVLNSTMYDKVHRQTVYLANRAHMFFWNKGFVCGNNVNKFFDKPKEKFPGAFVAEPTLVSDRYKQKLSYPGMDHPVSINVCKNANDYDYKRLYPSIDQEFNMAPNTIIGMIKIPNKVYKNENIANTPQFSRGGCFVENLASHNYIEFAHRWLNLGSYEQVLDDIEEYYTTKVIPMRPMNLKLSQEGLLDIATRFNKGVKMTPASRVFDINNKLAIATRYVPIPEEIKEKFKTIGG